MTARGRWLIGVDEVGRGPLAGPVMVGVAAVPHDFAWGLVPGVTDSKKLSEKKREGIFATASELQNAGKLFFAVAGESAAVIDERGIVPAIKSAMAQALKAVLIKINSASGESNVAVTPELVTVLLDGGLKAPIEFTEQQTIIKGDAEVPVIGLASIVAKVTRDWDMVALSARYPGYDLEIHKGYGTKRHREAITAIGLSPIHRNSFCKNCQK